MSERDQIEALKRTVEELARRVEQVERMQEIASVTSAGRAQQVQRKIDI